MSGNTGLFLGVEDTIDVKQWTKGQKNEQNNENNRCVFFSDVYCLFTRAPRRSRTFTWQTSGETVSKPSLVQRIFRTTETIIIVTTTTTSTTKAIQHVSLIRWYSVLYVIPTWYCTSAQQLTVFNVAARPWFVIRAGTVKIDAIFLPVISIVIEFIVPAASCRWNKVWFLYNVVDKRWIVRECNKSRGYSINCVLAVREDDKC